MTNFNDTLLKVINEKKLYASQFAEMVDIRTSTFYDLLRSENPTLKNTLKIVDYLNSSLDYFEKKTTTFHCKYKKGYKVDLVKSLKTYLKKNKVSYVKLCEDIGLSKANISRWKHGDAPKYQTVVKLANYFNESIDKFIGRT